jgi:hypothetical protein
MGLKVPSPPDSLPTGEIVHAFPLFPPEADLIRPVN